MLGLATFEALMSDTISELRLALRAAGHAPVPACGKAVYLPEWTTKGTASAEEIASWAAEHPDWNNTGVLCSKTPALDIDLRNPEAAEAVADMVREWFDGRGAILTRTGEAPKRAIPFRTEQPFQKILVKFVKPEGSKDKPPGIEMLAHGQQFIVAGIHPDTGRPYSWHAERNLLNTPRHDLPEINEAEAQSLVTLVAEMLVEKFGFQVDTNGPGNGGADMFDGDTNGGGCTNGKTDAVYDSDGRLDVEASLAAMTPSGASVNDIQPKVILSLLQRAVSPTEVIDTVVDATMDMATRNGLPWTREVEVRCVDRRVDCDLKKLQGEYDYRSGEIPRWLAEEFHQKWADTLAKGGRPLLSRNRHNRHLFSVWGYGKEEDSKEETAPSSCTRSCRSISPPCHHDGGSMVAITNVVPLRERSRPEGSGRRPCAWSKPLQWQRASICWASSRGSGCGFGIITGKTTAKSLTAAWAPSACTTTSPRRSCATGSS
jgi:hypothetical protein